MRFLRPNRSLTAAGLAATKKRGEAARGGRRSRRGQALVEYMLMTVMLLALFTGMYRLLQGELKGLFTQAGKVILNAYY